MIGVDIGVLRPRESTKGEEAVEGWIGAMGLELRIDNNGRESVDAAKHIPRGYVARSYQQIIGS